MLVSRSNFLYCHAVFRKIWPSNKLVPPLWGGSSNEQVWTGLQWWPSDVTSRGWAKVNGPISDVCVGNQSWGIPCLMSEMGCGPCRVRSNASWIMVIWGHPWEQTRVKTLPSPNLSWGLYYNFSEVSFESEELGCSSINMVIDHI